MRKGEKKPQKEQDRKRESLRKVPPARPPPFFLLLPALLLHPHLAWVVPRAGPPCSPTFVVCRKSRTALVHRWSASRSRTAKRSLPLPVAFLTSAHSV